MKTCCSVPGSHFSQALPSALRPLPPDDFLLHRQHISRHPTQPVRCLTVRYRSVCVAHGGPHHRSASDNLEVVPTRAVWPSIAPLPANPLSGLFLSHAASPSYLLPDPDGLFVGGSALRRARAPQMQMQGRMWVDVALQASTDCRGVCRANHMSQFRTLWKGRVKKDVWAARFRCPYMKSLISKVGLIHTWGKKRVTGRFGDAPGASPFELFALAVESI